ncbi:MAG: sarcosine oxidase [Alphaproteobacteria bacterium]
MATGVTQPADHLRRSFVYRELLMAGAHFSEENGAAVVMDFGDPAGEEAAARCLGLADLSPLPRVGFKGAGTVAWLAKQKVAVPPESNQAVAQGSRGLAARLAPEEVLVLGSLAGHDDMPVRLSAAWAKAAMPPEIPRGFPVPRADRHAWFLLTGADSPAMFAKICGVDVRPAKFAVGRIAQTSIARLNGIVIRDDQGGVPAYHLLADSASAGYLWGCLRDAMTEFRGIPIGLRAVRSLAAV